MQQDEGQRYLSDVFPFALDRREKAGVILQKEIIMMKNMYKKLISVLVALAMLLAISAAAVAAEGEDEYVAPEITNITSDTYINDDGALVEEVFFYEDGIASHISKITYPDASFTVTVEQGDYYEEYEGTAPERESAPMGFIPPLGLPQRSSAITYPHTSAYNYLYTDYYSVHGVYATAAAFAAAVLILGGFPPDWAITGASALFAAYTANNQNLWCATDVYLSTTLYAPGSVIPMEYHYKFVTWSFTNQAMTNMYGGANIYIYNTIYAM
jgi:hypothetical protein